jgi:hypothetical protein
MSSRSTFRTAIDNPVAATRSDIAATQHIALPSGYTFKVSPAARQARSGVLTRRASARRFVSMV